MLNQQNLATKVGKDRAERHPVSAPPMMATRFGNAERVRISV
jgi:hypothetical protein